jgi:hypothetical protein
MWLDFFGLLVVAALNVLAAAEIVLCVGRPSYPFVLLDFIRIFIAVYSYVLPSEFGKSTVSTSITLLPEEAGLSGKLLLTHYYYHYYNYHHHHC